MTIRATVQGLVAGPVRQGWKSVAPRLPDGVADRVSGSAKRGLRRVGLLPGSRGRVHQVGGLAVTRTWPGVAEELDDRLRGELFDRLLGPGDGRSLVDLGAGPCHFARRATRLGWKVTAVDGRTERLPDDLDGITFVQADVRDFDTSGFDTVACLGLLYHLEAGEQEALLRRSNHARVILETQVHTPGYVPPAAEPWGHRLVTVDGYEGVSFPEGNNPMASIGNRSSLWVTEESLLAMVDRAGFRRVDLVEPAHHAKYGTRRFLVLQPE